MNRYEKYIGLKMAIESLFGRKSWYDLKESNHLPTWRKYSINLLKSIKISIDETIEIFDDDWKNDINREINHGIKILKSNKNIDDFIATIASTLIKISFLQIGFMPCRYSSENVSLRKENWKLDVHRSVNYTQTKKQKENFLYYKQEKNRNKNVKN